MSDPAGEPAAPVNAAAERGASVRAIAGVGSAAVAAALIYATRRTWRQWGKR